MEYLKKVGANIKHYRQLKGMSQEELALKSGYGSRATLSIVESGGRDIPNSKLKAIADALGVSVGQLLDEEHKSMDGFNEHLIQAFYNADEKTKQLVVIALDLVEYFKN